MLENDGKDGLRAFPMVLYAAHIGVYDSSRLRTNAHDDGRPYLSHSPSAFSVEDRKSKTHPAETDLVPILEGVLPDLGIVDERTVRILECSEHVFPIVVLDLCVLARDRGIAKVDVVATQSSADPCAPAWVEPIGASVCKAHQLGPPRRTLSIAQCGREGVTLWAEMSFGIE
jgi:hypothetical protein